MEHALVLIQMDFQITTLPIQVIMGQDTKQKGLVTQIKLSTDTLISKIQDIYFSMTTQCLSRG